MKLAKIEQTNYIKQENYMNVKINKKRIFDRLQDNDIQNLKIECLDIIAMCYTSLGQKPDKEQLKGMSILFYNDLINYYTNMTMHEVAFAINKGLRNADEGNSVFINVRTWNVWLKNYKKNAIEKRRLNQHTEYELYKNTQKLISKTINAAKRIK
tara:strand:- start:16679 stop:17143 length:465 start_codon:yes stop_codon:yes gene_type:complete